MAAQQPHDRPSRLGDVLRPPVRQREYWLIQVLVVLVFVLHAWVEYLHLLDHHSPLHLFPTTLFLIPVTYAAVTYGAYGALATGALAALLTLPNLVLWHPGFSGIGETVQVAWIVGVGTFVGMRVDGERQARAQAEWSRDRVHASEERYRSILENIVEPIILLDGDRRVLAVNDAAAHLLDVASGNLIGRHLDGPTGSLILRALPDIRPGGPPTRRRLRPGGRWYDIYSLETDDGGHGRGLQLLLIDVTAEQERITTLEELTRATLAAREAERLRIARDLHDGPLQSIIAIHRSLDTLGEEGRGEADEPARAKALAQDAAEELRRVSFDLRPAVLDDLGGVAAIASELQAFEARTGIATRVDVAAAVARERLTPEREVVLFRVCQEALANVERHAGASVVRVMIDTDGEVWLRLRVDDDGTGITLPLDRTELSAAGHLGLIGMEERARLAGGTLMITSSPMGGGRIEMLLPRALEASDLSG